MKPKRGSGAVFTSMNIQHHRGGKGLHKRKQSLIYLSGLLSDILRHNVAAGKRAGRFDACVGGSFLLKGSLLIVVDQSILMIAPGVSK